MKLSDLVGGLDTVSITFNVKNFPVEEVTAEVDQMKLNAPIPKIKSIT
jgi:hypothetical protein